MKIILITGGGGFIGYHLARFHVELGDEVWILDSLVKNEGKKDQELKEIFAQKSVHALLCDMRNNLGSIDLPQEIDTVYHLAAINGTRLFYEIPYELCRNNLLITINLLDRLESVKVKKLVYSSSSEVYSGASRFNLLEIPSNEETPVIFPQPTDVRYSYGTSKFMGEFLTFQFGKKFKIPIAVIRYHNIYGPRMGNKHVIPEFILRMNNDVNPFPIYGGNETRAFCYVDDAVKAICAVAESDKTDQEIVHVGNSKEEIKIAELAKTLMKLMQKEFELEEKGGSSSSVSRRCPDTTKLKSLTGFESEIQLEDGLKKTMDWYLTNL